MAWVPLGDCACECGCAACETVCADWNMPFAADLTGVAVWLVTEPSVCPHCFDVTDATPASVEWSVNPYCAFSSGDCEGDSNYCDEWFPCQEFNKVSDALNFNVGVSVAWNGSDWVFTFVGEGDCLIERTSHLHDIASVGPTCFEEYCTCVTAYCVYLTGSGTCELMEFEGHEYNMAITITTMANPTVESTTDGTLDPPGCDFVSTTGDCDATDAHGCPDLVSGLSATLYYKFTSFNCLCQIKAVLVHSTGTLTGVEWPEELTLYGECCAECNPHDEEGGFFVGEGGFLPASLDVHIEIPGATCGHPTTLDLTLASDGSTSGCGDAEYYAEYSFVAAGDGCSAAGSTIEMGVSLCLTCCEVEGQEVVQFVLGVPGVEFTNPDYGGDCDGNEGSPVAYIVTDPSITIVGSSPNTNPMLSEYLEGGGNITVTVLEP